MAGMLSKTAAVMCASKAEVLGLRRGVSRIRRKWYLLGKQRNVHNSGAVIRSWAQLQGRVVSYEASLEGVNVIRMYPSAHSAAIGLDIFR